MGISLTGTPNGLEKLTVAPADANAIYDANDNKASVKKDLRNSANLFDKTPPTIVSTTNNQNEYIDVFFSEPVFSAGNAYSTLDKNDFKLELTGGTATLSTTTPKGIMGYADRGENSKKGYKFRLEIKGILSGVPNGEEKISVTPVANSIFDMYGNAASTTQKNNLAQLSKSKILNVGQLEYNADVGKFATVVEVTKNIFAVA